MLVAIALSFLAGLLISINRVIVARLSFEIGAMASSFWNHVVGMIFMLLIVFIPEDASTVLNISSIPWYCFVGGAMGAIFVAINSWVIPALGATKTILLVIGFQMLSSTLIDFFFGRLHSIGNALLGTCFIICGFLLGLRRSKT
ncbi:MAG: DMT family transporter [Bdellovibrionota bacterium]